MVVTTVGTVVLVTVGPVGRLVVVRVIVTSGAVAAVEISDVIVVLGMVAPVVAVPIVTTGADANAAEEDAYKLPSPETAAPTERTLEVIALVLPA